MTSTFIIAEAGSNHNKNFNQAISLIDIAKQSNASAVKFQTYSSETLYTKNTPDFAAHSNISKLIKDIEIPRDWQPELKSYCDDIGIEFMSTPFDEKAVDELFSLGVRKMKIAGFESTDFRFVDIVASTKLPLIISIGIGFEDSYFDKLLNIVSKHGNELTLLHCNNAYPTPMQDVNLLTIRSLLAKSINSILPFNVGFSDHTTSTITPSLAVAIGASVIEKHFTLSKHLPGPDHAFALEPYELQEMIRLIQDTEHTLSYRNDKYTSSEQLFAKAMRSVVAKTIIKSGEVFSIHNITTKRPFIENCIPAADFSSLLGTIATRDYEYDDYIIK